MENRNNNNKRYRVDKRDLFVVGDAQPIKPPLVGDVSFSFYEVIDSIHSDPLYAPLGDKASNIMKDIDVRGTSHDNILVQPHSKVVRTRSGGGGAFYSRFIYRYIPRLGSEVRVLDFSSSRSFYRRVPDDFDKSFPMIKYCNVIDSPYDQPFTKKIIPVEDVEPQVVLSYYNNDVFHPGDISDRFFSSIQGDTCGFAFYFDPFKARQISSSMDRFVFYKQTDSHIYYNNCGVEYTDRRLNKNFLIEKYGQTHNIMFMSLAQLDRYLKLDMGPYVESSKSSSNRMAFKCVKVMFVRSGASKHIPVFTSDVQYKLDFYHSEGISGKCIRPFMMTYDRADEVSSSRAWWAQKIDGYQAVIQFDPARSKIYNLFFTFRNRDVYATRVNYRGTPFVMQATVVFDGKFSQHICINNIYYEDMISGDGLTVGGYASRAILSYKVFASGFRFTMKPWKLFENTPVYKDGKDTEGVVIQLDDVYRRRNGSYEGRRSCFYLSHKYTIDVSMIDETHFVLDGVTYELNEGSSPVREIYVKSWEPFVCEFVRDRVDRSPQFHTHNGSDKNSLNESFVTDYKQSMSLSMFNTYFSPSMSIDDTPIAFLYSQFRAGKILTDLASNSIDGINALIATGVSPLRAAGRPVEEGFYVWRHHFRTHSLEDVTDTDIDFDDITDVLLGSGGASPD